MLRKGVAATRSPSVARGAAIMVACVTLAKFIGAIYIIPLNRIIGKEGLGIYSNAYALYVILLTVATAGFPTAMGKLVSERLALGRYAEVERIYQITMRVLWLTSVVAFLLMWVGAPVYSALVALRDPHQAAETLTLSIRALAFSLLIVPWMSGLRGYLQGFQRMEPSAYSQAIEQIARVAAIVIGAYAVKQAGGTIAQGAAAATFGSCVGAAAGALLLVVAVVPVRRDFLRRWGRRRDSRAATGSTGALLRQITHIAVPVSLGAMVVPIAGLVDSLMVQNLLMWTGMSFHDATGQYGILSRYAYQLIQLPLSFAFAIGASVLPAVASAVAMRRREALQTQITGAIRSQYFLTFPAAAVLLVLAVPIDYGLFGSDEGAAIISSVSFMSVFSSLELISTYILQGLGQMYRPVRNMFIGIGIKTLFNLILIPPFHIMGAAVASTIGYLCSSTLNVLAVKKYSGIRFSAWRLAIPPAIASVILCVVLGFTSQLVLHLAGGWGEAHRLVLSWLQILVAGAVGGGAYTIAAIWLRAATADELARLPRIGRRLARLAQRLQPVRPGV
ncbi:MAG: polysaccharide biosynthesis protein [Thermoflavifilum sp.]|nr:polysaccharide biosynthesis protein [Thermoflavifilum sp.]MCL6515127.1 polysaccharide biosynthesis protein [Alicyclobacillus sp.]